MSFAEKNRIRIEKLQNLPENKKKIILWTIVAILAVIMGFFWVRGAINNFSIIGQSVQGIKLPKIDTSDMPKIDLQKIGEQIQQNQDSILNTTTPSK